MTCTHPVPVHLEDNLRESPPSRSNSKAGPANAHVGHRLKLPDVRQFVPPARAMAISRVQLWWTLWTMLWQTNMALEGLDKSRAVLDGEAQAPVVISDRIRARLTPLLSKPVEARLHGKSLGAGPDPRVYQQNACRVGQHLNLTGYGKHLKTVTVTERSRLLARGLPTNQIDSEHALSDVSTRLNEDPPKIVRMFKSACLLEFKTPDLADAAFLQLEEWSYGRQLIVFQRDQPQAVSKLQESLNAVYLHTPEMRGWGIATSANGTCRNSLQTGATQSSSRCMSSPW